MRLRKSYVENTTKATHHFTGSTLARSCRQQPKVLIRVSVCPSVRPRNGLTEIAGLDIDGRVKTGLDIAELDNGGPDIDDWIWAITCN